ncbi:MAG: ASPIC/UnbV domain-containing protein, partial [Balneolaceae bacterium]
HSGIKTYGEQRGTAFTDLNNNGKKDFALSQIGEETKLYLNQTGKPGIQIRLKGPGGNPAGIGSSVRLEYEDGKKGPKRYIQAGSSNNSQNSRTHILGFDKHPVSIEVNWFDGTLQQVSILNNKKFYEIKYETM